MSDHDPLCPFSDTFGPAHCMYCDLIARVRADERRLERERIAAAIEHTADGLDGEWYLIEDARAALGVAARIARGGGRDE